MLASKGLRAVLVSTFLISFCPLLYGQATGSISGNVTDATGAPVSGAKVTVSAEATGFSREAVTDDAGHYTIPLLGVATYTVRAELKGFQTSEAKGVRLQVDEQRELDFKMVPASIQQTVEVTATPVEVQTTNPTLGQVITSQQVAELPLNGRDFVQLASLTPGTIQETNPNSFFNGGADSEVSARGSFSLSVGGSRPNSTDWLLDGNDNNELTAGGIAILPSIDAIQEFKVLTYNYSAQYGTRAGPTVLVTTKSGTNQIHGSVFEFLRNTDLDARSFFATSTEKFNLNQFGGSVGGPIKKDKTFFFADIQNKIQRHGIPFTGLVPSVAMRSGDFTENAFGQPWPSGFQLVNPNVLGSSNTAFQCNAAGNPLPAAPDGSQAAAANCNKIPQNLINPIAAQMVNIYPLPNANNPALGYNYVNEPVRRLNEGEFDIRIDHNFSPNDNAFARFSYDQATSWVPGGAPGLAEASPFGSNESILNHARNVAASETHVFSPNTVNQVSGGYNRIFDYIQSQGNYTCISQKLGIPGANLGGVSCGLVSTQLDGGYWSLGDRGFAPFQGGTNVFSISDSLDMVRGSHDLRVGGEIRANQMNVLTEGFQDGYWIMTGLWSGEPMADFMLGLTSLAIHDQTFDGDITGRRWKLFRPYIEDNWKVGKSLTLNLGLGWALTTPIGEVANRQADFNPANGQYLIAGQNADSAAGIHFDKTDLEPRIGVAWKPWGDKTVVRGGYAIFHDEAWSQGAQGLWQNPPFYAESDGFAFGGACTFATAACATKYGLAPSAISMSDGFPIFTAPPTIQSFTGTILSQDLDFKHGRVQQFNVNLERQLPGNVVLTAGYAGSRDSHLLVYGNNLNVTTPSACGSVSGYTLGCGPGGAFVGLPYPNFPYSTIANIFDSGKATYNSLQIKAETKSVRSGLYALVGYTYSHAFDNGFTDGLGSSIGAPYFPLPGWQTLDWARSQIDARNNFTASLIYNLPFGRGKQFGNSWNGTMNEIFGSWELDLIEKVTSGFPVFVVDSANGSGVNFENNGNSLNRPNQVCNPTLSNPTLSEWFNTACFVAPPAGELGNASRTPVSGPDFVNTDFSVIKHFPLPRESTRLDFRAEFFNLFNHPQFGLPVSSIGYADLASPATFGVINSTVNNPRVIQFALKLLF
ncbi:MAG TPA: carboxypeptidase-like regulatory domain-containing protein [Bryobacteraceae bacterium]|nr:carboxypeptidase-like regulatory domain-containing protein [Bryobacteraceae bacterium]